MTVVSMKTTEDKKVELEISVGAEEFGKAVDAAFKRNASRMQVPGFRKGKAPRKMIEKLYGEGVFFEEAVNNTYPAAYEAALEEKNIEPVDRASIDIVKVDKDGYTFKAVVTVKPEVSLEGYKGVEAEKVVYQVTDEDVDAAIAQEREKNARMVNVDDRAAQDGDTAVIDFEGFIDDVAFEGGKGEAYPLVIGSGSFIPGFEEQVIGHKPGEAFDVNVSFPEEYHAEELKGKAAVFKCTLKELKFKELPELDDEFAKDVSEFDTLEEYKADVRAKLQASRDEQAAAEQENKLMEAVTEKLVADIPECMYENRIDDMVQDFEYRLQSQGMNLQTYLQYTGMEMDAFRDTFRAQAQAQVKTRLALEKIAQLEKLEATQEEIDAEFARLAENYKMDVERIKKIVPQKDVANSIALNKAVDFVRDNAKLIEKPAEKPAKKAKADKAEKAEKAEKPAAKKPRAKKVKEEKPEDAE